MAVFVHEFKPLLSRDLGWQCRVNSGIVARFLRQLLSAGQRQIPWFLDTNSFGEVAEWSKAAVLKTVEPRGSQGSNPCLSAIIKKAPHVGAFLIVMGMH